MTIAQQMHERYAIDAPGVGKRTTAHLNLTVSMADPPSPSAAFLRARERVAARLAWEAAEGAHKRRGWYLQPYAGREDDDA